MPGQFPRPSDTAEQATSARLLAAKVSLFNALRPKTNLAWATDAMLDRVVSVLAPFAVRHATLAELNNFFRPAGGTIFFGFDDRWSSQWIHPDLLREVMEDFCEWYFRTWSEEDPDPTQGI